MSSLPSGIRLMNLLRDHLTEIMDRERANRDHAAAPVRLPVPDRDGVRYGSLTPFVRP